MTQYQASKFQKYNSRNVHVWTYCTKRVNINLDLKYRMFVPARLRKRVLDWFYEVIKHQGSYKMY